MKRPRNIAIQLVLFLLLGAIVNVAVAWTGNWIPESPVRLIDHDRMVRWPCSVPLSWPAEARHLSGETWSHGVDRYTITFFDESAPSYRVLDFSIDVHRAGWPMRSMQADLWDEQENFQDVRTSHTAGHPRQSLWRSGLAIESSWDVMPVRPIWPGFAINTIFYAAVLWVLFAAPGLVRRRLRRFRGRCINCGYDLRGHVPGAEATPEEGQSIKCPECGRSA